MNNRYTKEIGITLIALIITIIILLILAGVVINSLINNEILQKSQNAANEYEKQQATEIMNLKITNLQIQNWAEKQAMLTLQELADGLCDDEEIEYVSLESQKPESLNKIEIGTASSIYTKLKKYPYEFEIGSSLQIISIDGVQSSSNENDNQKEETYIRTGLQCYLDSAIESTKKEDVWEDLSGKNNNATLNGCTWTSSGLNFDGVDDWANLGYQDYGNFTLEIVFDTNTVKSGAILGNWETGGYGISINSSYQIQDSVYINGGYNRINGKALVDNTKYKVTCTCNGKENKIYVNGELIASSTIADGLIEMPDKNTVMAIGGNPIKDDIDDSSYFNGNVYLVRIYNRVLSENEVKLNYNYDNQNYNINDNYYENLTFNDTSYEIASVTDLEKFRDAVNSGNTFEGVYVELKNNLDLASVASWTPIGNENIAFKGIFSGNGYNITNLNIDNSSSYQGLFGNNEGIIENLNIKSGTINGTFNVGAITGVNSGIIINCSNEATIQTSSYYTGGICGHNSGNIERSYNKGYLYSDSNSLAGISGWSEGGIIKFCYNNGVIDSTSYNIGGIVGTIKEGIISSCYNTGNISTTGYNTNNNSCIAGIVGNITENKIPIIKFCYNTGNITGAKSYVGGISANSTNISYCYNTGNIVSNGGNKSSNNSFAGGIIARCQYTGISINYCYNIGTVTCTDGNKYAGGIAGATISGVTVSNCYTLSSAISTIIALDNGTSTSNAAKSDADMQTSSFITLLGGSSYWYLSEGYPKLIWE